jgi:hypothetical protein
MHRVILERTGFKNFKDSDHINQVKHDNRRSNLRPATRRQNSCNQGKRNNNTSGYIGVYWSKQRGKWKAQIAVGNKRKYLGYFTDKKEAACAYNKAAKKYHGEFSVLNRV